MDFLDKLGIDWKLFLAQLFNFCLLLIILYRFLYKPLLRVLDERRKGVLDSLLKAQELEQKLQDAALLYEERMKEAEARVSVILKEAEGRAHALHSDIVEGARKEALELVEEARAQTLRDREGVMREVLRESKELIKESVRKVLEVVRNEKLESALNEKALHEIRKLK